MEWSWKMEKQLFGGVAGGDGTAQPGVPNRNKPRTLATAGSKQDSVETLDR